MTLLSCLNTSSIYTEEYPWIGEKVLKIALTQYIRFPVIPAFAGMT